VADQPVTVREWTDVVRRARLGRTTKAVAVLLATYADYQDGSRVHPGIARISIDAELSYNVVKKSLGELRAAGLILLVRTAQSRGDADEYRLTLGEGLLDRVEVLSPAQVKLAASRLREARQGRHRAAEPVEESHLRPTGEAAATPDLRPTPSTAATDLRPTAQAADPPVDNQSAAHGVTPKPRPAAHGVYDLRPTPLPPTNHDQDTTPTNQPTTDLDLTVTHSRATGPPQDPISPPLPRRCPHGFRSRRRPDGSPACALCRVAEHLPAVQAATA
jgi:hypothetical protein